MRFARTTLKVLCMRLDSFGVRVLISNPSLGLGALTAGILGLDPTVPTISVTKFIVSWHGAVSRGRLAHIAIGGHCLPAHGVLVIVSAHYRRATVPF